MHQTMSDRLAVVLWWFIKLYSWSRFFLRTGGRTNEGNPRGPRGPKKNTLYLFSCYQWKSCKAFTMQYHRYNEGWLDKNAAKPCWISVWKTHGDGSGAESGSAQCGGKFLHRKQERVHRSSSTFWQSRIILAKILRENKSKIILAGI